MALNLTLPQKGLILVSIPLLFQLAFSLTLTVLLRQAEYEAQIESHAKEMGVHLDSLADMNYALVEGELSYFETGAASSRKLCDESVEGMRKEIAEIGRLVEGNPKQADIVASISLLHMALNQENEQAKYLSLDEKGKWQSLLQSMWQNMGMIRTQMQKMFLYESSFKGAEHAAKATWRDQLKLMIIVATGTDVLLAIALAAFFMLEIVRRLRVLTENSRRVAKQLPLLPPLRGRDEIGDVDRSFHDMAEALEEARKKERELQQLKQEFMQMVSHDLRTPITAVLGVLGMLTRGDYGQLNERGQKSVAVGERSLARLSGLINGLLDLEKLEAGMFEMNKSKIALQDVIEHAISEVKALAEQGHITIEASPTEAVVYADEERIIQVLVNLLGNALKYSPEGGKIEISVSALPDPVEVRVTDLGPGIPAAFRESVFDRFRQIPDGKEAKGGSGLGLAICKAIVEQHGGEIGVESEEGKGSTFWFRLPSGRESAA